MSVDHCPLCCPLLYSFIKVCRSFQYFFYFTTLPLISFRHMNSTPSPFRRGSPVDSIPCPSSTGTFRDPSVKAVVLSVRVRVRFPSRFASVRVSTLTARSRTRRGFHPVLETSGVSLRPSSGRFGWTDFDPLSQPEQDVGDYSSGIYWVRVLSLCRKPQTISGQSPGTPKHSNPVTTRECV